MRFLARVLVAAGALFPLACSAAEAPQFKAGQHYKDVRQVQAPADPTRIQVVEVFAYSCPHCFQFEPHLDKWLKKKPGDVDFARLPHTLGAASAVPRNKAYYAAEMLGVTDKFHRALFGAIHGQGRMMSTEAEIRGLFLEHTGVKEEDFDGAYKGFATDSRFRMGENAIREMGIMSVPAMVVDGRWVVTPSGGGGFPQMLEIVDFLVEKARQERKAR